MYLDIHTNDQLKLITSDRIDGCLCSSRYFWEFESAYDEQTLILQWEKKYMIFKN